MRLLNIPKKPLLESSLALACELLLAGGEMVCYNITAYNEIINFTVSKSEVYNSKLRAGIKAERGMVMKGKNLERAVILGLILSAGVYGTAWAYITPTIDADGKLFIEADQTVGTEFEVGGKKYDLKNFTEVEINFKANADGSRPLGVYSARYDLEKTNITVRIEGNNSENDSLHLTNHYPHFYVNDFTIYNSGRGSDGINLSRDITTNTDVIIYGDLTAVIEDGNGIRANASINGDYLASITVKENTDITINANAGNLVSAALNDAPINPTAVWAGSDANSTTMDQRALGKGEIYLEGNTKITLNGNGQSGDGHSFFKPGKVYGILTGKNGYIKVNNIDITANGNYSYGVAATSVNVSHNYDNTVNQYGSIVELNGSVNSIIMNGDNSYAIYAEGVDVNGNSNTVKSGEEGIGGLNVKGNIFAEDNGAIDLTVNNDKITDNDNNVYENYVTVEGDILAKTAGTINMAVKNTASITGNIEAVGTDSKINIGGILQTDTQNFARSNDTGKTSINITGDVQAANGATIDLSLGDGAYFAGRVDDYKDADSTLWDDSNFNHDSLFDEEFVKDNKVESSGNVNLTLGNNATWSVTEQSWVTTVNTDKSIIDLTNGNNKNYAVHIGTLNGDAKFIVNLDPNTDAVENNGNMIYVYDGTNADNLNLQIYNERDVLTGLANGERLRFATVANAGGGFGDTYVARGRGVINSGFSIEYEDYDTADTEENNKYNGGTGFDDLKPGSDYVDGIYGNGENVYLVRDTSKDAGKSDSGATIINMSRANYKNAIYMDRLNKRMGEMRYVNGEEEQGLWVRLRHDRIGQSGDFRSMNTMYEVGYDVKQPTDNGEHRIGMAIDYMRGSTTYDDIMGKGETKRYGLWLYDTWLGEKGHYTDYIVKWGHLSNDFDIRDKDSLENITGDYSNNVFSVSAEYGKKNDMGNNWYFEPQAQLQLARVTGADYVTTQGSKVNVDGINSLIGRAGFRIGRDMDENSTVYLKADLLHEFMGDQTVTAADATGTLREEFENKGTWYDVGFGFAAKMSKNSYAFMDFEKSFGNDNDETYQINAGMQWTF